MKKSIWWKTEATVFLYATLCLVAIAIQGVSCYVSSIPNLENLIGKFWYEAVNHVTDMKIDVWSVLWTAISCAYVGIDRGRCCIDSFKTTDGSASYGDPARLRKVILVSGILLMAAMACQTLKDGSNMDFAISGWVTAFGGDIAFYVAGMQAIKLTNSLNANKDLNGDGVVSPEEEAIAEKLEKSDSSTPYAGAVNLTDEEETMAKLKEALKTPEAEESKIIISKILKETAESMKSSK